MHASAAQFIGVKSRLAVLRKPVRDEFNERCAKFREPLIRGLVWPWFLPTAVR
jgi:hypothetical protein